MGEALAVVGQDWELDRAPGPAGGEHYSLSIYRSGLSSSRPYPSGPIVYVGLLLDEFFESLQVLGDAIAGRR